MKYSLYSHVILVEDIPAHGLCRGGFATIVEFYEGRPDQEPGYELEVFNAVGDTIGVHTIPASAVEPLNEQEVFCVRRLDKAAA